MSYCGPQWISLYNSAKLLYNVALKPESVGHPWWTNIVAYDPWWWLHYQPDPPWYVINPGPVEEIPVVAQKVITVIGVIDPSEQVQITSVTRSAVFDTTIAGSAGALTLRLHGEGGAVLAAAPVVEVTTQGGCGCRGQAKGRPIRPAKLMAHVPDVAPGTALSIQSSERTVWERNAPPQPVQVDAPAIERDQGMLTVTWNARWPQGATPQIRLRVSTDRGRTWKAVATGITESRATLDPAHLPFGQILLQVVAHDGFSSAHSSPTAFDNEARPPILAILHPHPKARLIVGEPLYLWGSAAGQHGPASEATRFVWKIDGTRAGKGLHVYTVVPPAGTHACSLEVLNAEGQVAGRAEVKFESVVLQRPAPGPTSPPIPDAPRRRARRRS